MEEFVVDIEKLKPKTDSTFFSRAEVERITGGVICSGTMANIDSRGEGPERFMFRNKTFYFVDSFFDWFALFVKKVERNHSPQIIK